jgi:hypothetical protein
MNHRTLTVGLLLSLTVAAGLAFSTGHLARTVQTGEAPIPQNLFGAPLPGIYTIELARPCGRLGVEVGKPWS